MYQRLNSHRLRYIVALLLLPALANAQQESEKAESLTTINFLTPGISREIRLNDNQTFKLTAMANLMFSMVISSSFNHAELNVDPAAEAAYRYYYNFRNRAEAGKRTAKNSANYISAYGQVLYSKMPLNSSYFEETERRTVGVLGTCWGMQRNYKGRFSLDLNLGAQYRIGKSSYSDINNTVIQQTKGEFMLGVGLTLGIWLN